MKPFAVIQVRAIVVAEHLFIEIAEQMERFDVHVGSFQSALEKAPEILQAVCMYLPIDIALRVVNRLVNEVLILQSLIGQKRIGVDRTLRFDVRTDSRLQVVLAARGYNAGLNLAATFQNSHDGSLSLHATVCNLLSALISVHESGRTADESFVHFYFFAAPAESHEFLAVHCKAYTVHHEPSRLLRDSKGACDFIGTDSVRAVHNQPHGNHPLIHAERGVLKDGPDFYGELFLASLAEPKSACRDKRVFRRIAARASHFACRPAQIHRIVESLLRVREITNGFLQRLGKLECFAHG